MPLMEVVVAPDDALLVPGLDESDAMLNSENASLGM